MYLLWEESRHDLNKRWVRKTTNSLYQLHVTCMEKVEKFASVGEGSLLDIFNYGLRTEPGFCSVEGVFCPYQWVYLQPALLCVSIALKLSVLPLAGVRLEAPQGYLLDVCSCKRRLSARIQTTSQLTAWSQLCVAVEQTHHMGGCVALHVPASSWWCLKLLHQKPHDLDFP